MIYLDNNGIPQPLYLVVNQGVQRLDRVPPPVGTPYFLLTGGCTFCDSNNEVFFIEDIQLKPMVRWDQHTTSMSIYYYDQQSGISGIMKSPVDAFTRMQYYWDRFHLDPAFYEANGYHGPTQVIRVAPIAPIPFIDMTFTLQRSEPDCHCRSLLDGHDTGCEYMKWKNKHK